MGDSLADGDVRDNLTWLWKMRTNGYAIRGLFSASEAFVTRRALSGAVQFLFRASPSTDWTEQCVHHASSLVVAGWIVVSYVLGTGRQFASAFREQLDGTHGPVHLDLLARVGHGKRTVPSYSG